MKLADAESEIAAAYESTIDEEYVDEEYEQTDDGQAWFCAMKNGARIFFDNMNESLQRVKEDKKFNTDKVEIEEKEEVPSMLDRDKENVNVLNTTPDNGIFVDKRMMKIMIISRMAVCADEKVKQNIIESIVTQMILQYSDESIKQTKFESELTKILMKFGDERISKMEIRDYLARKLPPKPGGYAFNKNEMDKCTTMFFPIEYGN